MKKSEALRLFQAFESKAQECEGFRLRGPEFERDCAAAKAEADGMRQRLLDEGGFDADELDEADAGAKAAALGEARARVDRLRALAEQSERAIDGEAPSDGPFR